MEKRTAHRFDKVFPVWVESPAFGECQGIARNISSAGMFVEMADPLPLGSHIRVHFAIPDSSSELVACAEVKRHYFLQFCDDGGLRALTGVGVRFTGFVDDAEDRLGDGMRSWRSRILH